MGRREYPDESCEDNNTNRRPYRDWRPLKEEDIQVRVEDHPNKEDISIGMEGLLEEEDILKKEGILEEDPLLVEDPLIMDPLVEIEDPLMLEGP